MFKRIRWKLRGSPTIWYPGYNCGLCGKWVAAPFEVVDYNLKESIIHNNGDNINDNAHTWGICPECAADSKRNEN